MIECPECKVPFDIEEDELDEGETLLCEECGKGFKVVSTDPVELEADNDDGFDDEEDDDFDEEFEEEDEEDEEDDEEDEDEDEWR
jgi:alpha-aminoadipate carrier protein LysW